MPFFFLFRILLACLPLAGLAHAAGISGSVTVAWNANTETNLSGYRVVYGTSSTKLDQSVVVGSVTAAVLDGLETGMTYYCAVQAFNTSSLYGDPSPAISFVVPEIEQAVIAVQQGSTGNALSNGGRLDISTGEGTENLVIRNVGNAGLAGLRITVGGADAAEFVSSPLTANVLAAGESTPVYIQFRPTSTGPKTATLHISGDGVASFDIILSGEGLPAPEIAVEQPLGLDLTAGRATIHFSHSVIGETGGTELFTIRNTGTAPLTGLALTSVGDATGDFLFTQPVLSSLAAGGTTTFQVSFRPTATGIRAATLLLASNDADENPFNIQLEGNGPFVPEISVTGADSSPLSDGASTVSFGNVNLGATAEIQILTITNTGTANITGLAITTDGLHIGDFTIGTPGATFLPPGASTTMRVTFEPSAAGVRTGSIHIASNDADENPFDITLNGTGIALPDIAVSRSNLTGLIGGISVIPFGSINLGAASATETLTINNTGTATLSGLAVSISGANPGDFTLETPATTFLAPSAGTTFKVAFRPTASGTRTATLQLASNDPDENPFTVTLTGTGVAVPEIVITRADSTELVDGSATIGLGSANLGTSSATQTLTIRNTGTAPLTGLAISTTGHTADFVVSSPAAITLAPGATTSFSIFFRPTAAGARTAALAIANNDADENPFDINLTGTGVAIPVIALEDGSGTALAPGAAVLNFPDILVGGSAAVETIVVKNTGTAALTGLQVSLSGTQLGHFILTAPAATTLPPGTSTTVQVTFSPQAGGGKTASLLIASSATPTAPLVLGLAGNATTAPEISVLANSAELTSGSGTMGFGKLAIGTTSAAKVFTIRNLGSAPLTGLAFRSGSGDFIITPASSSILAPGNATTFKVSFKPTAAGSRFATISIASNDADESPFTIRVDGIGVAVPDIAVSGTKGKNLVDGKAVINFGGIAVDAKGTQTVTIRNAGSATLRNLSISRFGSNSRDFTLTALRVKSLAPGASASVRITFSPAKAGVRWGGLRILSNDSDEKDFDIVLTGTGKKNAVSKGSKKKKKSKLKTGPAKAAAPAASAVPIKGMEVVDGKKYRTLTLAVTDVGSHTLRDIEVSGDLTEWASGGRHLTVLLDNSNTFKVRDNIPVVSGHKRYIRLKR